VTGTAVLIRAHNYGDFVQDAIDSALAQTVPPAQVVIVDDGSTDRTSEILATVRTGDVELRVERNERPVGPASALNQAAAMSDAGLLLALDADDRLSDRFIERTEAALDRTGCDVAHTGVQLFGSRDEWRPAQPLDTAELRVENCLPVSCLMRRWVLDAVGGFSLAFDDVGYEDWSFWLSAVERGARFTAVEDCWLEYRQHDVASRNTISHATSLRAHARIYRRHPSVHLTDIGRWMGRSAGRNLRRVRP
jgi:glycosyltransferase involved in cell wall biosynthesis